MWKAGAGPGLSSIARVMGNTAVINSANVVSMGGSFLVRMPAEEHAAVQLQLTHCNSWRDLGQSG